MNFPGSQNSIAPLHSTAVLYPPHPLATPDQEALELQAVALLQNPVVRAAKQAVARYWIDKVRPGAQLRERFEREFEQVALCGALNALNADPQHPGIHAFGRFAHHTAGVAVPGTKAGHPNPDYVYRFIPVDGASHYVVKGRAAHNRPVAFEVGVINKAQLYLASLSAHQVVIDGDGGFAISVDPEPANGRLNHLQSKPDACQIIIRDILNNVANDCPHALSVERIGPLPALAPRADDLAERCGAAIRQFVDDLLAVNDMLAGGRKANDFAQPAFHQTGAYPLTQAYGGGRFSLADDEAIVLKLTLGTASYAVVPVSNEWGGINNFLQHTGSLGTGRAAQNPDGGFTFVLSLNDPGVHNWIDPDGLREGFLVVRWAGFDPARASNPKPTMDARVVKFAALSALLDPATPRLDAAGRARQLEQHAAAYLGLMGEGKQQ